MGLLDDAIREHLELKRRAGADPQELEKLEREALGPVRRTPRDPYEDAAGGEAGPETALEDELPAERWSEQQDELEGEWADDAAVPSARSSGLGDSDAELIGSDGLEDWEAPERGPIPGAIGVEPDTAAPAPPAPPASTELSPAPGSLDESHYLEQETVEHEVEHNASEEDDMLEETPEFLQDTPDHDRLWFEQKPPRDFDLDG